MYLKLPLMIHLHRNFLFSSTKWLQAFLIFLKASINFVKFSCKFNISRESCVHFEPNFSFIA